MVAPIIRNVGANISSLWFGSDSPTGINWVQNLSLRMPTFHDPSMEGCTGEQDLENQVCVWRDCRFTEQGAVGLWLAGMWSGMCGMSPTTVLIHSEGGGMGRYRGARGTRGRPVIRGLNRPQGEMNPVPLTETCRDLLWSQCTMWNFFFFLTAVCAT